MENKIDICKGCQIELVANVNWPPSCKKHSDYWCRSCRNERSKQWRKDNPERKREYEKKFFLKNRYGLSYDQYLQMFEDQQFSCFICKAEVKPNTKDAHVDHCHSSGKVRSILCNNCNTGLGKFKDNKKLLLAAIAYLEQHGS